MVNHQPLAVGNGIKLPSDIITGTFQVTVDITQSMGIDVKALVAGMLGGKLAGGEDKTFVVQAASPEDNAEDTTADPVET